MLKNPNGIRESIIELFEIDKLPDDKKEETINKIGQLIFQGALVRVAPTLSEEESKEFQNMMDNGADPENVFEFFIEKVPDFMMIVADEAESLRKEFGQVMASI